jgi:hypothetical protein
MYRAVMSRLCGLPPYLRKSLLFRHVEKLAAAMPPPKSKHKFALKGNPELGGGKAAKRLCDSPEKQSFSSK